MRMIERREGSTAIPRNATQRKTRQDIYSSAQNDKTYAYTYAYRDREKEREGKKELHRR